MKALRLRWLDYVTTKDGRISKEILEARIIGSERPRRRWIQDDLRVMRTRNWKLNELGRRVVIGSQWDIVLVEGEI